MINVLIVDDYQIFRNQLKSLQYWKNQKDVALIGEASNGIEALEILETNKVDIILTDIKMPKLNGLELLDIVKQKNLCKCVILLSEYADFEYAREGIVLGAFDYMVKPVTNQSMKKIFGRAIQFIKDGKNEAFKYVTECQLIVEAILKGGNHFDELIGDIIQKCFAEFEDDIVKSVVGLMNFARETIKNVQQVHQWISLLTSDVEKVCQKMIRADDKYMASALFKNYLMELYLAERNWKPDGMSALSEKVVDYVLEHPYDKLTLTDISDVCFVSNTYLSHSFKMDMGKSFVDYVISLKMHIVKKLLSETDKSMIEIADELNYEDYKYMGRLFKKTFGFTLSDYKRMYTTE